LGWEEEGGEKRMWALTISSSLVHQWSAMQKSYLGARANNKANGKTWVIKRITGEEEKGWFKEWLHMWKQRNENLHGGDYHKQQQAKDHQTIHKLQLFYEKHDGFVPPGSSGYLASPFRGMQSTNGNMGVCLATSC
jgi:hypothetical protein